MNRWLKIAVPLGLAAVLVAVLAIGFGPPSSHAAKPSAEPTGDAECGTFSSFSGTVSGGQESIHTAKFCSDPDMGLLVALNWGNAKKDLRLVVIDPNGNTFVVDGHNPQPYEVYAQDGPLPEGKWTIMVEYDGKGKTKYDLWVRFN